MAQLGHIVEKQIELQNISRKIELQSLFQKIEDKTCTICVMGLGQVGLPTALSFLKLGFHVNGYDVNDMTISLLQRGKSHIPEEGFEDLIKSSLQKGLFSVSTSDDALNDADVIIVCVPTPLGSNNMVDYTYLSKAVETISAKLTNMKLIIIESTIPPRTMTSLVIPTIQKKAGKKAGSDFLVSFCPERIAPGNALEEFIGNSRIIGANDENSYHATFLLYKLLTKGEISRTDTTTAELSKLAENSYRDINIAFANELALICEYHKVDVLDVIKLANTHPRVKIHKPGPGVGGPCLPKDPYLLIMGLKSSNSMLRLARAINDSMPGHVVRILEEYLGHEKTFSKRSKILILGASYKPGVKDTRYSPSKEIVSRLIENGFVDINVHDPYSKEAFGAKFYEDLGSIMSVSDIVIAVTGHSEYVTLTVGAFKKGCLVIDAARIFGKGQISRKDIHYLALGSGKSESVA
jgi:UDP-N-acetyl-D-mannosaminuronic acid dehydrogenase